MNPNITMEDIFSHPKLTSNWDEISENPNLTMEFIISHTNEKLELGIDINK
jgi:hypothetical protein